VSLEHSPARTGRILRPREAAEYLCLSPSTLAKMRLYGTGPDYLKFGRRVAYYLTDCEAWAKAHRRQSTSDSEGQA